MYVGVLCVFFIEQKTAYDMRISDWSSDVCSSDLLALRQAARGGGRSLCSRHESLPKEWICEDLVRSYGAWGVGVPIFCPEPMPKGSRPARRAQNNSHRGDSAEREPVVTKKGGRSPPFPCDENLPLSAGWYARREPRP